MQLSVNGLMLEHSVLVTKIMNQADLTYTIIRHLWVIAFYDESCNQIRGLFKKKVVWIFMSLCHKNFPSPDSLKQKQFMF